MGIFALVFYQYKLHLEIFALICIFHCVGVWFGHYSLNNGKHQYFLVLVINNVICLGLSIIFIIFFASICKLSFFILMKVLLLISFIILLILYYLDLTFHKLKQANQIL